MSTLHRLRRLMRLSLAAVMAMTTSVPTAALANKSSLFITAEECRGERRLPRARREAMSMNDVPSIHAVCGGGTPGTPEFRAAWTRALEQCTAGRLPDIIRRIHDSPWIQANNFEVNPWIRNMNCDHVIAVAQRFGVISQAQAGAAGSAVVNAARQRETTINRLRMDAARGDANAKFMLVVMLLQLEGTHEFSSTDYNDGVFQVREYFRGPLAQRLHAYVADLEARVPNGTRQRELAILTVYTALSRGGYAPSTLRLAEIDAQVAMSFFERRDYESGRTRYAEARNHFRLARTQGDDAVRRRIDEMDTKLRQAEGREIRAEHVVAFIAAVVVVAAVMSPPAAQAARPSPAARGPDPCAELRIYAAADPSYRSMAAALFCWP